MKNISNYGMLIRLPQKRQQFHIMREKHALESILTSPPTKDEIIKLVSCGVFSAIGVIKYIADFEVIEHMDVSSFAVGAKHAETLSVLHDQGRIKTARFFVGNIMKTDGNRDGNRIDRSAALNNVCEKCGWNQIVCKNHSKIILMKTAKNYYVVETSSNLNENPKFEQFSFENNKTLYEFYREFFNELEAIEDGEA